MPTYIVTIELSDEEVNTNWTRTKEVANILEVITDAMYNEYGIPVVSSIIVQ